MATMPGVLLYERFGFELLERTEITLGDGATLAAASMRKPIDGGAGAQPRQARR